MVINYHRLHFCRFSLPSTSKKWGRLRLVIKSYLIDIMQVSVRGMSVIVCVGGVGGNFL